jgi:hypothetical protein
VDKAVKSALSSLRLKLSTIHLTDKFDEFNAALEKALKVAGVERTSETFSSPKYGRLGGGVDSMAWNIAYYLWNTPWEAVNMSKPEIIDYLKKHKNADCYTAYKKPYMNAYGHGGTTFGGYKKVDKDPIINADYGTSSKSVGYGSQASNHVTTVSLKKDPNGNLLLDRSLEVWD